MKKLLILSIGLLCCGIVYAQGYKISVKVNGLQCEDELLLTNHFGNKQYIRDTSECYNGMFQFTGENKLESGIYLVVLPKHNYFEIVISKDEDQTQYYFEADTALDIETLSSKGSIENQVFFEFNRFASEKGRLASDIRKKIEAETNEKKKTALQEELQVITKEVTTHRNEIVDNNSNLFVSDIYRSMQDVVVPDPPKTTPDSAKATYRYLYMRDHYWDNINRGEDGLVRTPIFHNKLKDYFETLVPPIPDTAIALADKLINSMEAAGSMDQFKYTITFLLEYFQKANYMCFDKATHHIVATYYCTGRAFWTSEEYKNDMCESAAKMEPTLCDKIAPDMYMPDSTFRGRNRLYDVENPVTVLVFWDYDCGHCKKEMPIIKAFYDSCNKEEVFVYAVYTQGDWEGWKKYIREKDLKFLNVANAFGEDEFRKHYNINTTPVIYVLDSDKKIVFKKIAAKDLASIVPYVLEKQKKETDKRAN